jgi:hypothetical protein
MSTEPALTGMPWCTTVSSVSVVEQIGGEDDAGGAPAGLRRGGVAGGQRTLDLAQRDRVHHHALRRASGAAGAVLALAFWA